MKIAVYDTYVQKKDGQLMHFDILVPYDLDNSEIIYTYGREYLNTKGQAGQVLSSRECRFCHADEASEEIRLGILGKGYYIIEMEGC